VKHKDQIQQLIETKTGTNNCLALQLMQSMLGYSFEKALLMLELKKGRFGVYLFDLLDIKIQYFYDHNIILDYIYIRRTIHYKKELLKEQSKLIYDGDPWDDGNGFLKGFNTPESIAIVKDLKQLSPFIEKLFQTE
jgi:hypothetical protein